MLQLFSILYCDFLQGTLVRGHFGPHIFFLVLSCSVWPSPSGPGQRGGRIPDAGLW